MNSGYFEEAGQWRDWLLRAVAGMSSQVQIMYGITGTRRLDELEVPWLKGYEGARPVRIGNSASSQLQLDIYGEIMDALHLARCGGLGGDETAWALQVNLLEHLECIWQVPMRALGNSWPKATLHPFQGYGLGCIRSRDSQKKTNWMLR